MAIHCLVCKEGFEVPATWRSRQVLVACPACGFLGHWSGQSLAIPTHTEEASLDRVEGILAAPDDDIYAGETTVMDPGQRTLPLPYKRKLYLKFQSGTQAGAIVTLTAGRVTIGRQDADVPIDDPKLSRKHAVIEAISRENIFLRDLASTNGTFLNGLEIGSKKLGNGDTIRVGTTELQFFWEDFD